MSDQDRVQALKDQAIEDGQKAAAKTFKPEPGDELIGKVTEVKYLHTTNGWAHLITVEDYEGQEWSVWCSAVVLKTKITEEQKPAIGAIIVIIYDGKKKAENSQYEHNSYQVRSEPSDPDLWRRATEDGIEREKQKNLTNVGGNVADDGLEAPY